MWKAVILGRWDILKTYTKGTKISMKRKGQQNVLDLEIYKIL